MKAKDLRNSILQMAVQGKLVPQDPSDEPASVLVERIRKERAKLIKEKKIKAPRGGESIIYRASNGSYYEKRVDAKGRESEPVCIDDEISFEIPDSWEWVRLESICRVITDGDHQPPPQVPSGVPFLVISNVSSGSLDFEGTRFVPHEYFNSLDKSRKPELGDLLFTVTGSFGIPVVVRTDKEFCFQRHIALLKPLLGVEYLWWAVQSPSFFNYCDLKATGTAQRTVSLSTLRNALVPIPPEAEQLRITELVDDVLLLVDAYGFLEEAQERLDAELPARLRKSVLQMAVQGKLVPQDPADEPASVLLERIRSERAALVKAKKLKPPKGGESVIFRGSDGGHYEKRVDAKGRESEPVCIDDEIPFEIPKGWEWARLESVMSLNSGLGYKKPDLGVKSRRMIRVLRGGNISTNDAVVLLDNDVFISSQFVEPGLMLFPGQIITPAVTSLENVGKSALIETELADTVCGGFVFFLTPFINDMGFSKYLHAWLMSPDHRAYCKASVKKSGQAFYNLSKVSLNNALIAIPPLSEQKRIVSSCERLLEQITSR